MADFERPRPASDQRSEERLSLLRKCGFPLQDRLERAVALTSEQHGWRVLGSEFPLVQPEDLLPAGFLDLVLAKRYMRMVIEVKKKGADEFIFPVPRVSIPRHSFFAMETFQEDRVPQVLQCTARPNLPVGRFALVTREDALSVNTVDRSAAALVRACDDLARLWSHDLRPVNTDYAQVFIPVIATSAKLVGALYDPRDVSLETGELAQEKIEFVEADAVRFQRPYPSTADPGWAIEVEGLLPYYTERTLFIVRASRLVSWLHEFDLEH